MQNSGKANSVVLVDKKLALTKLRVFYAVNQNFKKVEFKKGFLNFAVNQGKRFNEYMDVINSVNGLTKEYENGLILWNKS